MQNPNVLKFYLICFFLFTIVSCETDIDSHLHKNTNDRSEIPIMHHRTMKEVLAESDQLKKSISKLTNSFRGDSLTAFSNINTGFSIDETKVLEKQFSNFTEYVFIIKRPENLNHKLENYVQRIYHNDSISQYLVEYAILEQNDVIFLDFNNIKVTLLDEPSMIIPFSSGCLPEFEDVEVCTTIPCTGTDNNNNNIYHYSSHECDCNEPGVPCSPPTTTCETFTVLVEDGCDGGGNTNSTETEPNPPVPPLGGNTSGTGNQSGSTLYTGLTPNSRTLLSAATRDFIEALPPNQKEWLESLNCDQFALIDTTDCDQELYDDIVEFLNGNTENGQVTAEAQTFFDVAVQELQNNPDAEVDWENQYIFEINETIEFQNHPCVKSIKDDLKNSSKISEIIKKFEPTFPILHLEWGMFTNSNFGNTGQTILNEDINTAFININTESFAHVSPIVIANTIAHELIHAELYRKLKELVDDAQVISMAEFDALANNFPGIKDYVFRYGQVQSTSNGFNVVTWSLTPDFSQAHHNQMADFYRGVLIDAMKAYDNANGINRGPNSDTFYEAISWAGLRSYSENGQTLFYDAWQNFVNQIDQQEAYIPLAQRTYNTYKNIINQEYNNPSQLCQ